jgi:hypothetical protein
MIFTDDLPKRNLTVAEWADVKRVGYWAMQMRPAWATGCYVTRQGIIWGKRTSRNKAPANYIFFTSTRSTIEQLRQSEIDGALKDAK